GACNNSDKPTGSPSNSSGSSGGQMAGGTTDGKKVTVKIITNNSSNFWNAMEKGMDVGKEEMNCDASRIAPPGQKPTNNDQKTTFESVLSAGPDGIAVSPIEADAFTPVIDAAIAKGVPVITFDSDAPKSKRLAYLGTNNYEAGKKAGEAAVKLLPQGGKYVAFVGMMTAQNARDRYQGFQDAVKGHNFEELQAPYQDNADQTGAAHRNVADALTKYGDKVNLMLGIWSYNGPAIVDEVMKESGRRAKTKIVVFDGDPKTLQNIHSGNVDAAVVQKPYEFGRLSVRLLYLIKTKGSIAAALAEMKPELDKLGMTVKDNQIDTGVDVILPGPAGEEFLKKIKEKGLEST
ncbi:MAG: sugar-binding protein, partial [Chthonomonadales bacterium]